jgi:hypothetical protein
MVKPWICPAAIISKPPGKKRMKQAALTFDQDEFWGFVTP